MFTIFLFTIFLRQIEFPTSCYEIILHEYLESSYLVNQFFDVIFYVQPPRHFCTLGTPREYTLNIGFTYWDIPKIFKVYEKSRCARDKYKAEVFRTQEHLFGAWQCKQTIFLIPSQRSVLLYVKMLWWNPWITCFM